MCVINDLFGHTHSPANSDHYISTLKFDLICKILKSGDRRTDGRQQVWK